MLANNTLKERLRRNEPVLGCFQKYADPVAVELLALSGFDFVIIDNEHCQSNPETLFNNVRTAQGMGMHALVRVQCNEQVQILKALDMGASGVQVPNVDTEHDARRLVSYARFAPEGVRGFGNTTRAGGYGTVPIKEFMRRGNEETLVIAHCETRAGVANLDGIVTVPGLDVVFIGPGDLSQAYGCAGEPQSDELKEAIDRIIRVSLAAGKCVGIACPAAQIKDYFARGVRFFAVGTDHSYTLSGAGGVRAAFEEGIAQ